MEVRGQLCVISSVFQPLQGSQAPPQVLRAVRRVLYTLTTLSPIYFPDALERKSKANQLRYEVVNFTVLVACLPILLPRNRHITQSTDPHTHEHKEWACEWEKAGLHGIV